MRLSFMAQFALISLYLNIAFYAIISGRIDRDTWLASILLNIGMKKFEMPQRVGKSGCGIKLKN